MKYQKFEDDKCEILKYDGTAVIKDKSINKYYETTEIRQFESLNWMDYSPKISSSFVRIILLSTLIGILANCIGLFSFKIPYSISYATFFVLSIVYTVIQVAIHESAHVICLRIVGRKPDNIGIKMNYIFPSFYIRMNDLHMLTREEKVFVHIAGIFVNVFINIGFLLVSYILRIGALFTISQFFVIGIIMNATPVLNSDGYKVLLALFSYNEKRDKINNNVWIRICSYLNILISIVYAAKLLIDIV